MVSRAELQSHLQQLLGVDRFRDYGPNGLQVEGRAEVRRLVSGVTASLALIEAAVRDRADAILVHHGLFWRGQDGRITGWLRARVALLLAHDINLFAYHLPLDAHPELGNNAQFGARLGLQRRCALRRTGSGLRRRAAALTSLDSLVDAAARVGRAGADRGGRATAGRCDASAGAPAAPRAISRRRSQPVSTPT